MPLETPSRIVQELARRGYNAEREAVTLIASAADPPAVLEQAVENAPDDALRLTVEHVRAVLASDGPAADAPTRAPLDADAASNATLDNASGPTRDDESGNPGDDLPTPGTETAPAPTNTPSTSTGASTTEHPDQEKGSPVETKGVESNRPASASGRSPSRANAAETAEVAASSEVGESSDPETSESSDVAAATDPSEDVVSDVSSPDPPETETRTRDRDPTRRSVDVAGDITGESTGTGEYKHFVQTFRNRYERLSKMLRGRVNHRPAEAIQAMPAGSEAAMIGLVNDIRSTASGHWLVELEDTTGTFPVMILKDRELAGVVDELLMDECVAVEGTLSDDSGLLFVDTLHFPDVPRTFDPNTADRHVQAALISDVHVGSQEFAADAWHQFADWLHTEEADPVEYLLIAGDMVEGVGVYPDQDEELDIVDIYEQYERFAEYLKEVPGDMDIVMVPGNHDAVRLAEPQPGFDEELRGIMSAHDARITGNPSTVTIEGVSVLMYHGVSLDEVIAELPAEKASYDEPHEAMARLLKKRHLAPQYGGHMRLAPEERDYLVIDTVPDVFHTGHVHKIGWGQYHNVLTVNSGCWQEQTAFQRSVNIDPDVGYAPILDLDTAKLSAIRKFS